MKSYLPCVPIHSTRVCSAPLELFLQSLAKKLLCVMQQKQRFSNLQFGTRSVLWERFFILFVVRKNDIAWESTSLMWDVARCQTQTDTKPIGICSEILSCLCTYTLPHMYVQPRLNFALKSCQRVAVCRAATSSFFSVLQCKTRSVLLDGSALYLLFAKPTQLENPPFSYRMWQGARLRPIQNW